MNKKGYVQGDMKQMLAIIKNRCLTTAKQTQTKQPNMYLAKTHL